MVYLNNLNTNNFSLTLPCRCFAILSFELTMFRNSVRWKMAYIVAQELVAEALNRSQRPYTGIASVHIFLHCVAIYSEQVETCDGVEEKLRTRNRPDHQESLEKVRYNFHCWLRARSMWLQLNETLKVFLFFI